jgi:hypothetical protein
VLPVRVKFTGHEVVEQTVSFKRFLKYCYNLARGTQHVTTKHMLSTFNAELHMTLCIQVLSPLRASGSDIRDTFFPTYTQCNIVAPKPFSSNSEYLSYFW